MSLLQDKQYKLQSLLASTLLLSSIGYFAYHVINGNRGLLSLVDLTNEEQIERQTLDELKAQRLVIEHKVNLMRVDSLDLDILDEQVKKNLGYNHKNEEVYIMGNES